MDRVLFVYEGLKNKRRGLSAFCFSLVILLIAYALKDVSNLSQASLIPSGFSSSHFWAF